jgi:hypothetical protein
MWWRVEIGHFRKLIDAFELQIEVLGILEKKVGGDRSIGIKNPFCVLCDEWMSHTQEFFTLSSISTALRELFQRPSVSQPDAVYATADAMLACLIILQ